MIGLVLSGCGGCSLSSEQLEFRKAEEEARKKSFEEALKHYQNVVNRHVKSELALRAAKESARLNHYELKRYGDAIASYKHVVLYSSSSRDRVEAQKKIADLHFNQTLDYAQAITEYSRLLDLPHTPAEEFNYHLVIARSYFYLNNFYQAQVEIDSILAGKHDPSMVFDSLLLKANILLTTKKLDDAIVVLRQLIEKYPERSKAETIGLILAVCYEEQKNFVKAIETLESIKNTYPRRSFIENRIKALRERQSYLPGAKGLKK